MRAVNLLVHERKQRKAPNKTVLAGVASSGAVLMLLGAGYVHAHSTVQQRKTSLEELKNAVAALPKPKPVTANSDAKLVAEKAGRLAVLSSALSTRVNWDRLLRELSIVLPADVWLDSLDASAPTAATAQPVVTSSSTTSTTPSPTPLPPATSFTIVGHTYNHEGVARLLIRLQLVPDLQGVQLVSTQSSGAAATKSLQFTINGSVKAPGARS